MPLILDLVAEWIRFTLFGIILPTIKLKVYTSWGLRIQQLRGCSMPLILDLVAEWIHFTLFWDNITHYKTESVHFLGFMNNGLLKRSSEGFQESGFRGLGA